MKKASRIVSRVKSFVTSNPFAVLGISLLLVVGVPAILQAADLIKLASPERVGSWRGNELAAKDIDANFAAIDAESVTAVALTIQKGTNTATFTAQSSANYITNVLLEGVTTTDKNDQIFFALTNITFQKAAALTNGTVAMGTTQFATNVTATLTK